MIDFKGSQFELAIILWGVRWYVAYPISYRQLEEMVQQCKCSVGASWCMDGACISVKGQLQSEKGGLTPAAQFYSLAG